MQKSDPDFNPKSFVPCPTSLGLSPVCIQELHCWVSLLLHSEVQRIPPPSVGFYGEHWVAHRPAVPHCPGNLIASRGLHSPQQEEKPPPETQDPAVPPLPSLFGTEMLPPTPQLRSGRTERRSSAGPEGHKGGFQGCTCHPTAHTAPLCHRHCHPVGSAAAGRGHSLPQSPRSVLLEVRLEGGMSP